MDEVNEGRFFVDGAIFNIRDMAKERRDTTVLSGVFIVLWSTAWIAGKYGLADAGPMTLLFYRFATAALILLGIALFTGARWPSSWRAFKNIAAVGALMQACGLGGVYFGMHLGVNAGVSSLIAGLSPLLTAIGAWWFLNDRIGSRQWLGVALGIVGVGIVVADKLALGSHWQGYAITFAGLTAFVAGTLYQKKYCDGMDLKTGSFIQTAAAAVVIAIPALVFEGFQVSWTPAFVGAVAWMAVVNSAAAMTMMLLLLSRGSASSVAALFYLVPPITASMAYIAFHEAFGRFTLIGFAVVAASVYLGTRPSGIPSTRDFRLSSAPTRT